MGHAGAMLEPDRGQLKTILGQLRAMRHSTNVETPETCEATLVLSVLQKSQSQSAWATIVQQIRRQPGRRPKKKQTRVPDKCKRLIAKLFAKIYTYDRWSARLLPFKAATEGTSGGKCDHGMDTASANMMSSRTDNPAGRYRFSYNRKDAKCCPVIIVTS